VVSGSYQDRKKARIDYYQKYVYKWKQRDCVACNGSGYYDDNGSPPRGSCNGTGKEFYPPEENED